MSFDEFLNQAWNDHASSAAEVTERLPRGLGLCESPAQSLKLLRLAQHLWGEHLPDDRALTAFCEFAQNTVPSDETFLNGLRDVREGLDILGARKESSTAESPSVRVGVNATNAVFQIARGQILSAKKLFEVADLEASRLPDQEPAVRTLAAQANNAAVSLESRDSRSEEQTQLMLTAARMARKHWARAGGWMEIERAEYRLAMSSIAAGDAGRALMHARNALSLIEKNGADAFELFFVQEACTRAHLIDEDPDSARRAFKLMNLHFEKIPADLRQWCVSIRDELASKVNQ